MPEILRYRGDLADIDRDQMLGPDTAGRRLAIKTVDYDPGTDVTTVTLRGILPAEFRERIKPLVAEQLERERIRKVFEG